MVAAVARGEYGLMRFFPTLKGDLDVLDGMLSNVLLVT